MSWHLKPSPSRWDRFFGKEILLIYAKFTGDQKVKNKLINDLEVEKAFTKKLTKELQAWVNEMEEQGYASE